MTLSGDITAPPLAAELEFARRLAALAELCVARGINLQRQQELIVSAPLEAAPLVQQIARCAYTRGASAVTCLYTDPVLIRDHLTGSAGALDYAPEWLHRGVAEGLSAGAARLQIVGPYPDLLVGIQPERITRAHRALAHAGRAEEAAARHVNCSIGPVVTGSWARRVFPSLPEQEARSLLWEAVFHGTLALEADPLRAWDRGISMLNARRDVLQNRGFRSLRFHDGRTDLRVQLADGHRWAGGSTVATNGVEGIHSIPAEEVFTTLRASGTEGKVFFSRPLAIGGALVENLYVEFKCGSIATLKASSGLETFEHLLGSDESVRRLGEVGLVPASSRVASANILFWNTLFDRNAASHVTFGQSVSCGSLSPEAEAANTSAMHIDCMLGHAGMQVDGMTSNGDFIPVMRDGEFSL